MIVFLLIYLASMTWLALFIDRRMAAAQAQREAFVLRAWRRA